MGSKSSAPQAPDPSKTASTQAQYDQNTAAYNASLNRYNVYTPYGSMTWNQTGTDPKTGAPIYSQNVQLSPYAQQALTNTQMTQAGLSGLQQQALGYVGNEMVSNPWDESKLPAQQVNPGQTAQDAIMSRLQPQIDQQNKQFDAQMANQGIPVGSDAYEAAHRELAQQQNDMQMQAALQGISVGQQARQQAIQEQGYYANAPLNYLNALETGSQVQTPQFQGTPSVMANAPNYQSAVNSNYQGQLNAYNAQTGSQNSFMGGLMNLGGSYMMGSMFGGSDASIKQDIVKIGHDSRGFGIYRFQYRPEYRDTWGHGPQIGVIAQEVQKVMPEAVARHPDGYLMVDYWKLQ
jgi:hypothetical protein